jgi:3D-(3,5/4)-trihydroxycyclohexane-1,2-dione acylhydrolase (decyclizing)
MTVRLTVAQALVRFLTKQWSERDGRRHRLVAGCFGIFGHGNVAGIGQALLEAELAAPQGEPGELPYYQARNEQAMVHAAAGYARMRNRMSTLACTSSIGPGATNMVTGAALATINRLPVLLLPGDLFATRVATPVLQELEDPRSYDASVNDCFRPVSRFFDRIHRPEQLPSSLLAAMRVLTDPAETGAVTLALPQDVQAEAYDWPDALFDERVWPVARPAPDAIAVARAAAVLLRSTRPLLVAGGGVRYAQATAALRAFAEATGTPVAETQAGKGSLPYDHPLSVGAIGATGTTAANALAARADVVIGVGTRWSDFTTASRSLFADADVRFVNLNVSRHDTAKLAGVALTADARIGLDALRTAVTGWSAPAPWRSEAGRLAAEWDARVTAAYHPDRPGRPLSQAEVLGAVNELSEPRDVVVCAAGSMPGDLHKLWRTRDSKGYHVEYGYSCMGYEIAGGLGVKMAAPDREVFVLVGDGSYLMMSAELVTAVAEGVKLVVVLVDNHGFASIGNLSESVGGQRFGTRYRYRSKAGRLDGDLLPVDLAANAASLGAQVIRVRGREGLRAAITAARAAEVTTVVHVETDPLVPAPSSDAWWDVPVAEVAALDTTRAARSQYESDKRAQRAHLGRSER